MKSNVSDYLELAERVYYDATAKCIADVFDVRDLFTIRSRVEHEGLSFLTISLPGFCNAFERSLQSGFIESELFVRYRFGSNKGRAVPVFLQGLLTRVFDNETGRLLPDEDHPQLGDDSSDIPTLVESVRQICLTFKKVEMACTPKRVQAALDNFVEIEQSFQTFSTSREATAKFLAVSSVLWHNMVANFNVTDCTPKHGPGATAEKRSGNAKFRWLEWHDRLEPYFPLVDNGYPLGVPVDSEELQLVTIVPQNEERPVRVVLVPKTLKSPRVIAIEPACMQYVQQGIRDWLYASLESYPLTRGHVNFRDQGVNQELALTSSSTGLFATIDLSDASDRVPHDLAMEMFRGSPDLRDSIDACRSTSAHLPDGRDISPLGKFASMGSALCFPVEAMYFYTICVVALLEFHRLPATYGNVKTVTRGLYIYGDDIVVPTDAAMIVLDHLQKYNCKVNHNKTFVSGSFRESCGVDGYSGYEVTPTYVRHPRPENVQQADRLVSWVATANLFYLKGYWQTTTFMIKIIERILGPLPYVSGTSPGLGRISLLGYESIGRWNRDFQRNEIFCWVPTPRIEVDPLNGYGALTKCFLGMQDPEKESSQSGVSSLKTLRRQVLDRIFPASEDASQLEVSAVRGALALRRRWVTAH